MASSGERGGVRRARARLYALIRALALDDLQEHLRGRWSDVTEIAYRPGADGYIKTKDEVLQTVIEGVTDQ